MVKFAIKTYRLTCAPFEVAALVSVFSITVCAGGSARVHEEEDLPCTHMLEAEEGFEPPTISLL